MAAVRIFSLALGMISATKEPLKPSMYISVHRQTNKHADTLTLNKAAIIGLNINRNFRVTANVSRRYINTTTTTNNNKMCRLQKHLNAYTTNILKTKAYYYYYY